MTAFDFALCFGSPEEQANGHSCGRLKSFECDFYLYFLAFLSLTDITTDTLLNVFLAIAVDNLANAQELTKVCTVFKVCVVCDTRSAINRSLIAGVVFFFRMKRRKKSSSTRDTPEEETA